jgi:hypothetical protein
MLTWLLIAFRTYCLSGFTVSLFCLYHEVKHWLIMFLSVLTGARVLNTLSDHSQCTVVFSVIAMVSSLEYGPQFDTNIVSMNAVEGTGWRTSFTGTAHGYHTVNPTHATPCVVHEHFLSVSNGNRDPFVYDLRGNWRWVAMNISDIARQKSSGWWHHKTLLTYTLRWNRSPRSRLWQCIYRG